MCVLTAFDSLVGPEGYGYSLAYLAAGYLLFTQVPLLVHGVLAGAGEFSAGGATSTFAVAPRRLGVLTAKAVTTAGVAAVTGVVTLVTSSLVLLASPFGAALRLGGDEQSVRILLGAVASLVLITVLALAVGALLRRPLVGIAVMVALGLSEDLEATIRAGAGRGKRVGAGTVDSRARVRRVAELGAAFTVRPGFDEAVARESIDAGLPTLPGVATASEIQCAMRAGFSWLKAFPAAVLGAAWFTAMSGPFPHARFVATGGMSSANAAAFFSAGADVIAVGSSIADSVELERVVAAAAGPSPSGG